MSRRAILSCSARRWRSGTPCSPSRERVRSERRWRRRQPSLGSPTAFSSSGQRTDVRELLVACDVFALPFLYEGSSLAVLGAMVGGHSCEPGDRRHRRTHREWRERPSHPAR
jgi:hypothetical protein